MKTDILIGLFGMILHEAAHIVTARSFGINVKRIGISWKGLYVIREAGQPFANLITTLAGPLMNLSLVAVWPVWHEFALVNLVLAVYNLMPTSGSDGQRAWHLLTTAFRGPLIRGESGRLTPSH